MKVGCSVAADDKVFLFGVAFTVTSYPFLRPFQPFTFRRIVRSVSSLHLKPCATLGTPIFWAAHNLVKPQMFTFFLLRHEASPPCVSPNFMRLWGFLDGVRFGVYDAVGCVRTPPRQASPPCLWGFGPSTANVPKPMKKVNLPISTWTLHNSRNLTFVRTPLSRKLLGMP